MIMLRFSYNFNITILDKQFDVEKTLGCFLEYGYPEIIHLIS